jgi:hypothetical protein
MNNTMIETVLIYNVYLMLKKLFIFSGQTHKAIKQHLKFIKI